MKSPSPQLGYNHNIPHRGRLYHVQTEDSGVDKAHIFTHVFYDGTIIASRKTEYREKLGGPEVGPLIIALMQDSHKAMIRSLRNGEYAGVPFRRLQQIVEGAALHPLHHSVPMAAGAGSSEASAERGTRRLTPSGSPSATP